MMKELLRFHSWFSKPSTTNIWPVNWIVLHHINQSYEASFFCLDQLLLTVKIDGGGIMVTDTLILLTVLTLSYRCRPLMNNIDSSSSPFWRIRSYCVFVILCFPTFQRPLTRSRSCASGCKALESIFLNPNLNQIVSHREWSRLL